MAIDSRNKRMSLLGMGSPIPTVLTNADGAVETADRAMFLWLYYGLALASPSEPSPAPTPVPPGPYVLVDKRDWEFYLRQLRRDGTVVGFIRPLFLTYTKRQYGGQLEFGLNANDAYGRFEDYDIIEVWLRNLRLGIHDGSRDFVRENMEYLFRDEAFETDENLLTAWRGICVSKWQLLQWPKAMWPIGVENRSVFTDVPAETIAKNLITYNATSEATMANGRWRDYDLAEAMGFTVAVAADLGRGNSLNRKTEQGSLLGIIQDLAVKSGGGFRLVRSGNSPEWAFDFSEGQQGTDKYDQVIFSLARRNMIRPQLRRQAVGAATVAVVAGQGEAAARQTAVALGEDYASLNDIEMFLDARDLATEAELIDRGEERLEQQRARYVLTFEVAQTPDTFYSPVPVENRHTYDVGDVAQARYFGTRRREITAVTVDWQPDSAAHIGVESKDGRDAG